MIRVAMMTLVTRDDRGEMMNQEEADKVSDEVNSRGEVFLLHSRQNDQWFSKKRELVGEQEWRQYQKHDAEAKHWQNTSGKIN